MTIKMKPATLAGVALTLCLMAGTASSQTPFEAEIGFGRVSISATLPEGWVAATHPYNVELFLPEGDQRVVSLVIGAWARERLGNRGSFGGGGVVEARRIEIGGQAATLYHGPRPRATPVTHNNASVLLRGDMILIHLDGCHGDRQDPVLLLIATGGDDLADPADDPLLAPLLAGLAIVPAAGAEPCPPGLTAALGAVPAAVTRDGWTLRERFGLSFWLPEGFEVGYDDLSFDAIHPDHDDPDQTGIFGFSLQRLFERDQWRNETPPDAVLTVLPDRDFGAAGPFEVVTAAFEQQGYAIDGAIMIAREPDRNERYLMVMMVSAGQPGQEPWLGLQDLRDEIMARLGRP